MSGVIPRSSPLHILFPATLTSWFASGDSMHWIKDIAAPDPGQPSMYSCTPARSSFSAFSIPPGVQQQGNGGQPEKSGAFVPHPSRRADCKYIDKILMRLTLTGAIYVTLVCLLPEFLILKYTCRFISAALRS